jgi:hypothetical protein
MVWQDSGRIPSGAKQTVVEKTDSSKKASGRSQASKKAKPVAKRAAKKAARKVSKPAATASKAKNTAAKKPVAKKGRKRIATAVTKEELAARRIAGGQDTEAAASNGTENQPPSGIQALAARTDDSAGVAPEAASAQGQPEAVGRVPESGKRSKTEPRTRAGESAEGSLRPNTLVPTNGIHTTERRLKRNFYQNRGVMALIAATLLGILILGEQTTAPDMTDFEQEIAASQAIETNAGSRVANSPSGIINPKPRDEAVAISGPDANQASEQHDKDLNDGELVEMERLLARLDLGPSTADGIVDNQTQAAIRLYQEIAGLPIDGAPSQSLLADIREVVKILEDGG